MVDAPTRRTEALSGRRRNPAPEREMTRGEVQKTSRSEVSPEEVRREPAHVRLFIPRVCKYLDHRGLVGGATLAHWSGKKGA